LANGVTNITTNPLNQGWQLWGRAYVSSTGKQASSQHEGYELSSVVSSLAVMVNSGQSSGPVLL